MVKFSNASWKEMRIECKFLPRQDNGILFEDEVSFTAMSINPDFANETITGRLQTLNSYDPPARLLTLIGCCEVMLTSLIGVRQSLETIDIIFFIASHVEAAEEINKQQQQQKMNFLIKFIIIMTSLLGVK